MIFRSFKGGFNYNGERFHLICLGMKGDLPYLAKTGNFTRHWLRAERKVKDDTSDSKKRPGQLAFVGSVMRGLMKVALGKISTSTAGGLR